MFGKVSPWMRIDGYCAGRVYLGTDPANVINRVAFIEKTPRVRIRDWNVNEFGMFYGAKIHVVTADTLNWASGSKGGADQQNSRDWCDKALKLFGYDIEIVGDAPSIDTSVGTIISSNNSNTRYKICVVKKHGIELCHEVCNVKPPNICSICDAGNYWVIRESQFKYHKIVHIPCPEFPVAY